MSATGRSDVREENDVYVTPNWSIRRFLEAYEIPHGALVLDPCAANGELLTEIHRLRPDLRLVAIELRPEAEGALDALKCAGVIEDYGIGSFMELAEGMTDGAVEYVVTNPPYDLAEEFIRASQRVAKISAFLLRINFLGAKDRRDFSATSKPGLFISPNRPSFTGWGGDATEYAWFIYGDPEVAGRWFMLALASDEEIKTWNAAARKRYPHLKPSLVKARKEAVMLLNGLNCSVCGAAQFESPSGTTCTNGHGGVHGVEPTISAPKPARDISSR